MSRIKLHDISINFNEVVFEYIDPLTNTMLFFAWDYSLTVNVRDTIDGIDLDWFSPECSGSLPKFLEVQKAIELYCSDQKVMKQV